MGIAKGSWHDRCMVAVRVGGGGEEGGPERWGHGKSVGRMKGGEGGKRGNA